MVDYLPLFGVFIIVLGLVVRLNILLVILVSGFATGLIAGMSFVEILEVIGSSFTKNRYMSLFILILPVIGVLERYGLRKRAEEIIESFKNASMSKVLLLYIILRKVTNAFGLNLGGHPSMIRPLVAPMAEAAIHKEKPEVTEEEKERVRALSAASENFANFFSQLAFVGAGGLLLIKGVFEDSGYSMKLTEMFYWAVPTAIASFIIFYIYALYEDKKLARKDK